MTVPRALVEPSRPLCTAALRCAEDKLANAPSLHVLANVSPLYALTHAVPIHELTHASAVNELAHAAPVRPPAAAAGALALHDSHGHDSPSLDLECGSQRWRWPA